MNQVIEQVLQNTSWLTVAIPAVLSLTIGALFLGFIVEVKEQYRKF